MLGLGDSTAARGRVRINVAPCLFQICRRPTGTSIVLEWKRPQLSTPPITPSPLRTKGVHPNPGDGRFTRRARASQCESLSFLQPCPKLPERGKQHWRNSAPTKPLDACSWLSKSIAAVPRFGRRQGKADTARTRQIGRRRSKPVIRRSDVGGASIKSA